MPADDVFTPRTRQGRVRIPDDACMFNSARTRVVVQPGLYPLIENGKPVTATTPTTLLSGTYRVIRADCGLGCRCDAIITPID